jgi:hypothetical protein
MASLARVATVITVWLLVLTCGRRGFAQEALESEVKAAFIYNFIQFVEWPPAAIVEPSAPFRICVYGQSAFASVLERTVKGEQLAGHPLTIEVVSVGESATHCQVLFVPQSQSGRTAAALRAAGDGPVLSVGESPNFLKAGGMINLFVEGGRVRFDVNPSAASARGLVPSSKLLRIARNTSERE